MNTPCSAIVNPFKTLLVAALCCAAGFATTGRAETRADAEAQERRGKLEDGTSYMVCRPANWNGVVIADLDLLPSRVSRQFFQHLLREGYGLAGTARWVPSFPFEDNVRRVRESLAVFREEFGAPKRVIVYGRSRGGNVAVLAAALLPDEVDGAVAISAVTHAVTFNQAFDFFFVLKALLAPLDPDLEHYGLTGTAREKAQWKTIRERWSALLDTARNTREGNARMTMAFAIAQYAGFGGQSTGNPGVPQPDINDPRAVAAAMFAVVDTALLNRLNSVNRSPEPHGRYIGNEGIDYAWYYDNIDPAYKRVVESLYREAGLDIRADIERINREPRVATDSKDVAAKMDHPSRTPRGTPRIPLFRMDNVADSGNPTTAMRAYSDLVRWNGLDSLYRASVVGRGGHAHCTPAEKVAAIKIVEHRLDTGEWPDTDADSLNAFAASLDLGASHFIDYEHRGFSGQWRLHAYSRNFDLTFPNLLKSIEHRASQELPGRPALKVLSEIVLQAQQEHARRRWKAARELLASFETKAAELLPEVEARGDLVWYARLMSLQIARDERNADRGVDGD